MKNYYVYILAGSQKALYIGMTNDLIKRIFEHKNKFVKSFTAKYKIDNLVYYEQFSDPENAIRREKQLKKWNRQWKINLINNFNPAWEDLYYKLIG